MLLFVGDIGLVLPLEKSAVYAGAEYNYSGMLIGRPIAVLYFLAKNRVGTDFQPEGQFLLDFL